MLQASNKADAKIAGITPAVFILSGNVRRLSTINFISHLSFWIVN